MKEKIIPVLLIVLVLALTNLFADKVSERVVGIDHMKNEFTGLYNVLPANANISLAVVGMDSVSFIKAYRIARYDLTPRYVSANAAEFDTVLTLFSRDPTAEEYATIRATKKILWQINGSGHLFMLTCRIK